MWYELLNRPALPIGVSAQESRAPRVLAEEAQRRGVPLGRYFDGHGVCRGKGGPGVGSEAPESMSGYGGVKLGGGKASIGRSGK